jgi:hypothetical protein
MNLVVVVVVMWQRSAYDRECARRIERMPKRSEHAANGIPPLAYHDLFYSHSLSLSTSLF